MRSLLIALFVLGSVAFAGDEYEVVDAKAGTVLVPAFHVQEFSDDRGNPTELVDQINKEFPVDTSDLVHNSAYHAPNFVRDDGVDSAALLDRINKDHPITFNKK